MKNVYTMLAVGGALLLSAASYGQARPGIERKGVAPSIRIAHPAVHAGTAPTGARGGAPVNDDCSTVTPQALAIGSSLTFTGTTVNATNTGDAEAGTVFDAGGDTTNVWHAFTIGDCANIALDYCGTDPKPLVYWAGIATSCPGTDDVIFFSGYDFLLCADTNLTLFFDELPAGTYYIPVRGEPSTAGPYTLHVAATECAPPLTPPANDDCGGVVSLGVNDWCNFQYFTGAGATQTMDNDSCNGYLGSPEDDVWFSFVATAADLTIAVQGNDDGDGDNNTGYDAVMELYAACGSGSPLTCADASLGNELEQIDATGLTVGTTYYVRVFDWYDGLWPDHAFGICVSTSSQINIGMTEITADAFSIYPNPGTGVFNLQYSGKNGLANIEVMDVTGRLVYNVQEQVATGTTHSLDLTGVTPGNYSVRLTVNGVRTEQRLMVK